MKNKPKYKDRNKSLFTKQFVIIVIILILIFLFAYFCYFCILKNPPNIEKAQELFFTTAFAVVGLWLAINIFLPEFILREKIKELAGEVVNEKFLREYGDTLKRKDAHISRMTAYMCYKINSPLRSFSWCLRAVNDYLIDEYKGTFDFAVELLPILEEASCNILKVIYQPFYTYTKNLEDNILAYLQGNKKVEENSSSSRGQRGLCPLEKEDQETITAKLKEQIRQEFLCIEEPSNEYYIFERIFREICELHFHIRNNRCSRKIKEYKIMEIADKVKDILLKCDYVNNSFGIHNKTTERKKIKKLKEHFSCYRPYVADKNIELYRIVLDEVFGNEK